jgi:hypothetical protein
MMPRFMVFDISAAGGTLERMRSGRFMGKIVVKQ